MPCSVIKTLQELIRINSVNPAYDGGFSEAAVVSYIADFYQNHGIEYWEQEVLPGRSNLIAQIPGTQPGKRILFEAHTDTVGATDMEDPFNPVLREGRLRGRGSCDNKGGLAAMMHALAQIQASGEKPACEIWLAATIDEEHSCSGVQSLCKTLEANAAVVAEPTELRMTLACKGCVRWRIEVHGREAHSSKPHLGTNAIVYMAEVIRAIEKVGRSLRTRNHPLVGNPTCSIGIIRGGTQINVVPKSCIIEIDRRLLPGEEAGEVLAHYKAILNDLSAEMPALSYTMERPMILASPMETPASTAVVQSATKILQTLGFNPEPLGVPFSCNASTLAQHGVPCIVFGPGSIDQAHTPDEFVECSQVEQAVEFYRQMMMSDLAEGASHD